jgi:hypothetical protein
MCLSLNEIAHSLCLCEAEASVGNSPHCEFAGVSRTGTKKEEGIKNAQE